MGRLGREVTVASSRKISCQSPCCVAFESLWADSRHQTCKTGICGILIARHSQLANAMYEPVDVSRQRSGRTRGKWKTVLARRGDPGRGTERPDGRVCVVEIA